MFYEGQYTSSIYSLIKDQNYAEAIKFLNLQLEANPRSRAALSLLGYCNYMSANYEIAAEMYEQLVKYFPEVPEYRIYLTQSLYKAENYESAIRTANQITAENSHHRSMLQFAIKYQMSELSDAEKIINSSFDDRQDSLVSQGCLLYKEGKYEDAKNKFEEAKKLGETPDIEYNIGVCCYKLKMLSQAHICIQNILEYATKNHPELLVQGRIDLHGLRKTSVSNSPAL